MGLILAEDSSRVVLVGMLTQLSRGWLIISPNKIASAQWSFGAICIIIAVIGRLGGTHQAGWSPNWILPARATLHFPLINIERSTRGRFKEISLLESGFI